MKLKPYPSYKDSGVSWIGNIPDLWKTTKIKFNTYVKGRVGWHGLNSEEFSDFGVHLVTGTDFNDGFVNWQSCYRISVERYAEDPYIQLQENDLLITKDGTIGKLARVKNLPVKASLNSGIFLIRAENGAYLEDYLYWVLRSDVFNHFMDLNKVGSTIQHLYQDVFNRFAFPIPSYNEQKILVSYLDNATSKLETLISKQEKLIELLQEKRQAIISHAVTKGLNPDAKMKDSGVEWLGMVPEGWKICAAKYLCDVRDGTHDTPEYVEQGESTYPLVTSKDLASGKILFEEAKHISEADYISISKRSGVNSNDLLMPMIGTVGGAVIVNTNEKFAIKNVALFKPYDECNPLWLNYQLNSEFSSLQFNLERSGGVQAFVALGTLRNLIFPVPSIKEQSDIVEYLNSETYKIDVLVDKAKRSIELAKEHRSALISAAVTGKIDVREAP